MALSEGQRTSGKLVPLRAEVSSLSTNLPAHLPPKPPWARGSATAARFCPGQGGGAAEETRGADTLTAGSGTDPVGNNKGLADPPHSFHCECRKGQRKLGREWVCVGSTEQSL